MESRKKDGMTYEHFKSVYEFDSVLNNRKVNPIFFKSGCLSSHRADGSTWSGTKDFPEAQEFMLNGWNAKISQMKEEMMKYSQKVIVQRQKMLKSVVGYIPCVPNAIKGVPKSMYAFEKKEREEKRNTIHLVFNSNAACGFSSEQLLKCGLTVLKLAMILDKSKIRTQIDVVPFMSFNGSEAVGCTIQIKDYRQSFNFSKMAYPIANPAFFRRHGFNYLEKTQGISNSWKDGYGRSLAMCSESQKEKYLKFAGLADKNVVYIDIQDCSSADYDPIKLAVSKGIKI